MLAGSGRPLLEEVVPLPSARRYRQRAMGLNVPMLQATKKNAVHCNCCYLICPIFTTTLFYYTPTPPHFREKTFHFHSTLIK